MKAGSLPAERHQKLLQIAREQRVVRVSEAADALEVHEMTIRRDLDTLAEQGLLERVHGGARLLEQASAEVNVQRRLAAHTEVKRRLAQAALAHVQPGDTLAIDASTTGLALAKALRGWQVSVIITNLEAANALAEADVPFILVGGAFHPKSHSFVGALAEGVLAKLNPDKVFFSAKGFSLGAGFSDAYLPEAAVKTQLIARAHTAIALLDSSKFGGRALHTFARAEDVRALITERVPDDETAAAFARAGTVVTVAEGTDR